MPDAGCRIWYLVSGIGQIKYGIAYSIYEDIEKGLFIFPGFRIIIVGIDVVEEPGVEVFP